MDLIDLRHLGNERVIGTWRVDDALVDPGPTSTMDTLLAALDGWEPRVLALTHIHLDHAGATGALVRRWPDVKVLVHERGARHLADPSKLVESAGRLYGDEMDRLWGEIVPVPEDRLTVLEGGEETAGFRVAATPGHAAHHVCYLHEASGRAFVGDVGGVRIGAEDAPIIVPTPPPDIDIEAWQASLDLVESWHADSLAMTHFGAVEDVPVHLTAVREELLFASELARSQDRDGFIAAVRERLAERTDEATVAAYIQAAPPDQLYAGLDRYWSKREAAGRART
jgi:glyoxylase-like metal-dependent hydrolase (beta-lactamase superfamily II)